jgi:hypothetical protein
MEYEYLRFSESKAAWQNRTNINKYFHIFKGKNQGNSKTFTKPSDGLGTYTLHIKVYHSKRKILLCTCIRFTDGMVGPYINLKVASLSLFFPLAHINAVQVKFRNGKE